MAISSQYSIQILSSKHIDKREWNACLNTAKNKMIYAEFDYLQLITDNWCGIVVNDYEAIMPIPYRSKYSIKYCYDVPFIQQLGLFGNDDFNLIKKVIETATKYIRYGDLFFNFQNDVTQSFLPICKAENDVLPLFSSYQNIYNNYSKYLQTKLKKAQKKRLFFQMTDDVEGSVSLFQQLYSQRLPQIKSINFEQLKTLAKHYLSLQRCFVADVLIDEKTKVASALFFKDENRIYNILPSTTGEGRKLNAMHFLLDNVIQKYAETSIQLDFEGSDVPGIKSFYQSFGAINQPFFHYHFNRLPLPLRWLKK